MAAKKSTRLGRKTGERPGDAEKVKRAFTKMMDTYVDLKQDQEEFEASAGDLIGVLWHWSIPGAKVKRWRKVLRAVKRLS